VHLTTPASTDLCLDATGRLGNALTGIVESGQFSPILIIETNFSPVEDSALGIIVADASIPHLGIGMLVEPVRLVVQQGFITYIDGGAQAKVLSQNLAAQGDINVYNIAELGVGFNPKARLCGRMLEDEGILGVVHIGIGTNITFGGKIKVKVHYDLLMHEATLIVDKETILEEGQLAFV
jgi:2,5-dihydroxypyridine 5,6-dioxygenase